MEDDPAVAREVLAADDGRTYIDLFCGSGTVLLGHSNPVIVAALQEQLGCVWNTGTFATSARADAQAQIEWFFPASLTLAGLYSTGMEAAEFALRPHVVAECARTHGPDDERTKDVARDQVVVVNKLVAIGNQQVGR